jgi:hypothetical protein
MVPTQGIPWSAHPVAVTMSRYFFCSNLQFTKRQRAAIFLYLAPLAITLLSYHTHLSPPLTRLARPDRQP